MSIYFEVQPIAYDWKLYIKIVDKDTSFYFAFAPENKFELSM